VASALRAFPLLRSIWDVTVALPEPDAVTTRSQDAPLDAFQVQPASVTTFTDALPPVCGTRAPPVVNSKRHGAGSCAVVTRASFSTMVPVRLEPALFSPTRPVNVPSPCPDDGDTPIHSASAAAVHAHSRAASTATLTIVPVGGTVDGGALSETWQRTMPGSVISVTGAVSPHAMAASTVKIGIPVETILTTTRHTGQDFCQRKALPRSIETARHSVRE